RVFIGVVWGLCGVMLINYMFFGIDLGILSSSLKYEEGLFFTAQEIVINILVTAAVILLLSFIYLRYSRSVGAVLLTGVIVLSGMSAVNIVRTVEPVQKAFDAGKVWVSDDPHASLSKEGENVVVIMLDRAMGQFVPYIFNEKPELLEQFDGFTYYSNTVSFGGYTNFGTPALFGGYEYTPVEINKRDTESLMSKQNEALSVMPVLFSENGYNVTVFDPPYANYQWIPELSIYDAYPEIDAYITIGAYDGVLDKESIIQNNNRNFFCFSFMKTLPVCMQALVYDNGRYHQVADLTGSTPSVQAADGVSKAEGMEARFMKNYNVLINLPNITEITDGNEKNFLLMSNKTTHEPMLLQTPDYVPAPVVDNTAYDAMHADRFTLNGKTMDMSEPDQMISYHANMAAMLQLGKWFDWLRENGVYDNTKIVLVSDHGRQLFSFKEFDRRKAWSASDDLSTLELYYPLLMVKDFGAQGFTVDDTFMTNADVPTLASEDVIEDPVNPFTGQRITNSEKTAHDQFVIISNKWNTSENNGNTFLSSYWASVSEDMRDTENWKFYKKKTVLKEHAAP
ncbi:MAG: sulfatase-like hydrolase/transferase, partial [Clostridia bacterium]|nr:sulfatase-like hydrolase/transferase [Clostridia bacterium]